MQGDISVWLSFFNYFNGQSIGWGTQLCFWMLYWCSWILLIWGLFQRGIAHRTLLFLQCRTKTSDSTIKKTSCQSCFYCFYFCCWEDIMPPYDKECFQILISLHKLPQLLGQDCGEEALDHMSTPTCPPPPCWGHFTWHTSGGLDQPVCLY